MVSPDKYSKQGSHVNSSYSDVLSKSDKTEESEINVDAYLRNLENRINAIEGGSMHSGIYKVI